MNTLEHSAISAPPLLPEQPKPEPALRILVSATLLTLVGDFLLWSAQPGLSWALFLVAICVTVCLNRPRNIWNRTSAVILGLLLATAFQSAVEISFTNVVVALALTVGLVGETSYPSLRSGWERCSEGLWAAFKAPGRWGWVVTAFTKLAWANTGIVGVIFRAIRIGLPALVLGVIFAALFGEGNAIFGAWVSDAFAALWRWLTSFDISLGHLLFFGLLATVSLVVIHPAKAGNSPRIWTQSIPKLQTPNPSIAW